MSISTIYDFLLLFKAKLPLLVSGSGKDVEELLKEMQEPGDEEVIGITEQLVDQQAPETPIEMSDGRPSMDTRSVQIGDQVGSRIYDIAIGY